VLIHHSLREVRSPATTIKIVTFQTIREHRLHAAALDQIQTWEGKYSNTGSMKR
jgi:hypothetical protein